MNNKIKTILTMVIVTIILTIGSIQMANAGVTSNNTIKSIETTESGSLITYNDNTGYYIAFDEVDNNVIEFINSKETKLKDNKITVTNIYYETCEEFVLSDGEIGVILSDGSWISANTKTNEYIFQPYDLGDWSLNFDSLEKLNNCVINYINNKGGLQ